MLCAVKGRAPSYRVLIEDLERETPRSALYNPIHFAAALNLFDEGDYAAAGDELRKVDEVAFVRFASVYRQFTVVKDFIHEIKGMKR